MTTETGFIASSGKDLSAIFAPISTQTTPIYSDSGTLIFGGPGPYNISGGNYFNMSNNNNNSFNKTSENNIVNVELDDNYASYFQFISPGLYNLTMSYSLTQGVNSNDNKYDIIFYLRLMDSPNRGTTFIPNIYLNFSNFYNVSSHGNNSNNNNISGQTLNNIECIYSNASTDSPEGYYVFVQNFVVNGSTQPYPNNFNVSVTVNVPNNSCRIYPQFALDTPSSDQTYPWTWEGNWIVTKLA